MDFVISANIGKSYEVIFSWPNEFKGDLSVIPII
jgi:hypothetical protein